MAQGSFHGRPPYAQNTRTRRKRTGLSYLLFNSLASTAASVIAALISVGYKLVFNVSQTENSQVDVRGWLAIVAIFVGAVLLTDVVAAVVYILWKRLNKPSRMEPLRSELIDMSLTSLDASLLNPRTHQYHAVKESTRG